MEKIEEYLQFKEQIEKPSKNIELGYVHMSERQMKAFNDQYESEEYESEEDYMEKNNRSDDGSKNEDEEKRVKSEKEEKEDEEYDEEETLDEIHLKLKTLFKVSPDKICSANQLYINENTVVTYEDQKIPLESFTKNSLLKFCQDAPYGDLKENKTVLNHEVRHALSCKNVRLMRDDKDITESYDVKRNLKEFFGMKVECVPHTLNIYEKDGHFKEHVDTQRSDRMVGTIVFIFSRDLEGGDLVVGSTEHISPHVEYEDENEKKRKMTGCYAIFKAITPHKVEKVLNGTRFSISYDICMKKKSDLNFQDTFMSFLEKEMKVKSEIGIFLENRYSAMQLSQNCALGNFDRTLLESPTSLERKVIPILWNYDVSFEDGEVGDGFDIDTNIVYTLDKNEEKKNIPFFCPFIDGRGFQILSSSHIPSCAYCGNECQNGNDQYIYHLCAVILKKN